MHFKDGTSKEGVATDITGFNTSSVGERTVTVTYKGFSDTVLINVVEKVGPKIRGYKIVGFPITLEFDTEMPDFRVVVLYDNNLRKYVSVSYDKVSGFDTSSLGSKTLSVNYEGKLISYDYIVVEKVTYADIHDYADRLIQIAFDYMNALYPQKYDEADKKLWKNDLNRKSDDINEHLSALYITDEQIDVMFTILEDLFDELTLVPVDGIGSDTLSAYVNAYATVENVEAVLNALQKAVDESDVCGKIVYGFLMPYFSKEYLYNSWDSRLSKDEVSAALDKLDVPEVTEFFNTHVSDSAYSDYADGRSDSTSQTMADYLDRLSAEKGCIDFIGFTENFVNVLINTEPEDLITVAKTAASILDSINEDDKTLKAAFEISVDDVGISADITGDILVSLSELDYKSLINLADDLIAYVYSELYKEDVNVKYLSAECALRKAILNSDKYIGAVLSIVGKGLKNIDNIEILRFVDAISAADKDNFGGHESLGKLMLVCAEVFNKMLDYATDEEKALLEELFADVDLAFEESQGIDEGDLNKGLFKRCYDYLMSAAEQYDYSTVTAKQAIDIYETLRDDWYDYFSSRKGTSSARISGYFSNSNLLFKVGTTLDEFLDSINTDSNFDYYQSGSNDGIIILATADNVTGFDSSKVGAYKFQIEYCDAVQTYNYYIYDDEAMAGYTVERLPVFHFGNSEATYIVGDSLSQSLYLRTSGNVCIPNIDFRAYFDFLYDNYIWSLKPANAYGFSTDEVGTFIAFFKVEMKNFGVAYVPYKYKVINDPAEPEGTEILKINIGDYSKTLVVGEDEFWAEISVRYTESTGIVIDTSHEGVTVSGLDVTRAGRQYVEVSYRGKVDGCVVNVITAEEAAVITDIECNFSKDAYMTGETVSLNSINVIYANGYEKTLIYAGEEEFTGVTLICDTVLQGGVDVCKKTATVSYGGFSVTKEIKVVSEVYANTLTGISIERQNETYTNPTVIGNEPSISQLYVKFYAVYGKGYKREYITADPDDYKEKGLTIVGYDKQVAGEYTCHLEYKGLIIGESNWYRYFTVQYITEAESKTPTSIMIGYNQTIYKIGDKLSSYSVKVTYGYGYSEKYLSQDELTDVEVSGYDNTSLGWQLLSFKYAGLTAHKKIKVISEEYASKITSIYFSSYLDNVVIAKGESIEDFVAKLHYSYVTYGGGYKTEHNNVIGDQYTADYRIEGFRSDAVGKYNAALIIGDVRHTFRYSVIAKEYTSTITNIYFGSNLDNVVIAKGESIEDFVAKLRYSYVTYGGGYKTISQYGAVIGDQYTADYSIEGFRSDAVGYYNAALIVGAFR